MKITRSILLTALASQLAPGLAHAAAFALQEGSGSGLGNAYAGGAATVDDDSVVWSNPAAMSRLQSAQFGISAIGYKASVNFQNTNSVAAIQQQLGGDGGNAGQTSVVPNLYLSMPINKQWAVGLGVNTPFGTGVEYDAGWIGRFQGIKTELSTVNVNPAVSWKATDNFALGFGLNYQKIDATFTNSTNYSAALLQSAINAGIAPGSPTFNQIAYATPYLEGSSTLTGSDSTWGWNLGMLFELDSASRIGAHYRSAMSYTVNGSVAFNNPAIPAGAPPVTGLLAAGLNSQALYNSGVTSSIKLPEIVNLSYFRSLNSSWDVMADLQYTGWSGIQTLTFTRTDGTPLQSTAENFKSSWRYAVGANYRVGEQWLLRAGLAYDQTPVQDAERTVRLPDGDRTWLTLGARYKPTKSLWFDVGGGYVMVRSASINNVGSSNLGSPPSAAESAQVNGTYHSSAVVLGGQLTYAF